MNLRKLGEALKSEAFSETRVLEKKETAQNTSRDVRLRKANSVSFGYVPLKAPLAWAGSFSSAIM